MKKKSAPKPAPKSAKERPLRKELIGIFLVFLLIFTLFSLLSYSPEDPTLITLARHPGNIHNLFGLVGASMAGFWVTSFGLGAYWLPFLLALYIWRFLRNMPEPAEWSRMIGGGMLLMLVTGAFMALWQFEYSLFGRVISAGGLFGGFVGTVMVRYANVSGGALILGVAWMMAFVLTTGLSLAKTGKEAVQVAGAAARQGIEKGTLLVQQQREKLKDWEPPRLLNPPPEKAAPESLPPPVAPPRRSLPAAKPKTSERQLSLPLPEAGGELQMPSLNFLDASRNSFSAVDKANLKKLAKRLESKLEDFGVKGTVVDAKPGPVITTFEYKPAPGVKINKIVNLTDDLALALRALSIRIVAPIPGKAVIGIEIPNAIREIVCLRDMVGSAAFINSPSKLTLCLGKDIVGNPVVASLEKMPHLLIAGATGTGKSVFLNAIICSILYKAHPEEVKLIMIDPKRIELSLYDGIPHLITPVVTDVKKATNALYWAVSEMERRYELLSGRQVRNITQYNRKVTKDKDNPAEPLPYVVVIIDELADLMMVASRDVEVALMRLAQMARAAGVHLILATQRPSVDVLTGVIKANFPTRLTFQVSSRTDSRTIIDANGAETLLGDGDMLFLPPGTARLQRIHGAFISEDELVQITNFLKSQKTPDYDESVVQAPTKEKGSADPEDYDERYDDAVALVTQSGQASISMVQRHLRIGYNRAARIIEMMEREGIVGPSDGVKQREVLVRGYDEPQE